MLHANSQLADEAFANREVVIDPLVPALKVQCTAHVSADEFMNLGAPDDVLIKRIISAACTVCACVCVGACACACVYRIGSVAHFPLSSHNLNPTNHHPICLCSLPFLLLSHLTSVSVPLLSFSLGPCQLSIRHAAVGLLRALAASLKQRIRAHGSRCVLLLLLASIC